MNIAIKIDLILFSPLCYLIIFIVVKSLVHLDFVCLLLKNIRVQCVDIFHTNTFVCLSVVLINVLFFSSSSYQKQNKKKRMVNNHAVYLLLLKFLEREKRKKKKKKKKSELMNSIISFEPTIENELRAFSFS